jgi:hypothetical protein
VLIKDEVRDTDVSAAEELREDTSFKSILTLAMFCKLGFSKVLVLQVRLRHIRDNVGLFNGHSDYFVR